MRHQTAWQIAKERMRAQERRLQRVALAKPVPVRASVLHRPAEVVPFTPPAVTIMAPKPETPADVHAFVLEEFREAQKKRSA